MDVVPSSAAAPLSADEHQQRVEQAFALEQRVKFGLRKGREALWATAEALYQFNEVQGWAYLGGYDTLGDWLADPDIGMTRSTYFRSVEVWRETVVVREIDPESVAEIDLTKVALALPAVKDGRESMDGALEAAATNGWRDMRDRYRVVAEPQEVPDEQAIDAPPDKDFEPNPDAPVIEDDEEALDTYFGERKIDRGVGQTLFLTLIDVRNACPPERRVFAKALIEQIEMALDLARAAGLDDDG